MQYLNKNFSAAWFLTVVLFFCGTACIEDDVYDWDSEWGVEVNDKKKDENVDTDIQSVETGPDVTALPMLETDALDGVEFEPSPLAGFANTSKKMALFDWAGLNGGLHWLVDADDDIRGLKFSNGEDINDDITSFNIPSGYEATVCTAILYGGTCKTFGPNSCAGCSWEMENYGLNQKISSIDYKPRDLWTSYQYLSNYPHDRENDYSENIQGVSHDANYWYIADKYSMRKIHITSDLNGGHKDKPHTHLPHSCDHFGDPQYYGGYLYAPLEQCKGGDSGGQERFYIYNPSSIDSNGHFKMEKYAMLGAQSHASWLAINPADGRIYSSEFYTVNKINVYSRSFSNGELVYPLYTIQLNKTIKHVQGGTFGPDGLLYLTADEGSQGIYVFRIRGRKGTYVNFISPNGYCGACGEEMEGITWWDLDKDTRAPKIKGGQLHWFLLDNSSAGDDDFYFKHVRIQY